MSGYHITHMAHATIQVVAATNSRRTAFLPLAGPLHVLLPLPPRSPSPHVCPTAEPSSFPSLSQPRPFRQPFTPSPAAEPGAVRDARGLDLSQHCLHTGPGRSSAHCAPVSEWDSPPFFRELRLSQLHAGTPWLVPTGCPQDVHVLFSQS